MSSAKTVPGHPDLANKAEFVEALFTRIAFRYDLMNELASLGQVRLWRASAAGEIELPADGLVLDIGAGTGEMARLLAKKAPQAKVIGLDFSEGMLRVGKGRLARCGLDPQVELVLGDGAKLPFPEGCFQRLSDAFLLRNVADLRETLAEMYRVLVPGGRAVSLEFVRPGLPLMGRPFDWYVGRFIPWLGGRLTGARWAYDYLLPSVRAFPSPEGLVALLEEVGFREVRKRILSPGVAMLYVAVK